MIEGVDSAYPPSQASIAAAAAAGCRIWSGYFAGPNILHGWTLADFDRVRVLGGTPIAYASGYSPPQTLKAQAAAWDVRLCLDVESGIRPDGTWVQPWLDESGAGLYGNRPVHNGRHAAFHVLAEYPAHVPAPATWDGVPPAGPHGWQYQGTVSKYGASVDCCWFDDWFAAVITEEYAMNVTFAFWNGQQHIVGLRPDGSLVQWFDFGQPPELIATGVKDFSRVVVDEKGSMSPPPPTPQVHVAFMKTDGSFWNAYQNIGSAGWNPQPLP